DWPRAPIAVRVDDLRAERVDIAPGVVAAQGLAFDAVGALRDEGDEQSARLTVTRTDDVEGRILIDFLRDFAGDRLDLTLRAEESPGGIVAELAGLPNDSASRIALVGAGPLDDWGLNLDAVVDRMIEASGSARLDATGRLIATADLSVTPGEALDPALRRALSPDARLRVDVAEDDTGLIRIREGALIAADLDLVATGTYDKTTAVSDFEVKLEARGGLSELAEGVDFDRLGFDGTVVGPPDDLTAQGSVALGGLATAPVDVGAALLEAEVRVRAGEIAVDVDGAAERLRLDRIGPDLLGRAEIALDGAYAGDVVSLTTLRLDSRPLTLEASGEANLAAETAALAYNVSAPDLAPLAAAYDVTATGRFAASGALDGPLAAPRLDGEAALTGLSFEDERLGAVRLTHDATFGETPFGRVSLSASGSRFGPASFDGRFRLAEERLALSDLVASALGAEVAGEVEIDLAATLVDGALRLEAPDIGPIGAVAEVEAKGAARGEIGFVSAGEAQNVDLSLTLEGIEAAGARLASATLSGDVIDALAEAPRLDLSLRFDGAEAAGASAGAGRVDFAGALDDLTFDAALERVAAAGAALASVEAEGRVTNAAGEDPGFDVDAALGGVSAAGFEARRVSLSAEGALSDMTLSARIPAISGPGLTTEAIALDARVEGAATADPALSADLSVAAATIAGAEARLDRTAL
ncbi:MAG: hypothetical protein AAF322_15905, partial [Pseudomonadota bacterium]